MTSFDDHDVQALLTKYTDMLTEPDAVSDEGRRLGQRDHVQADPELWVFLAVLIGHIAVLEDRIHTLTLHTLKQLAGRKADAGEGR
jgi:hypothetical protein